MSDRSVGLPFVSGAVPLGGGDLSVSSWTVVDRGCVWGALTVVVMADYVSCFGLVVEVVRVGCTVVDVGAVYDASCRDYVGVLVGNSTVVVCCVCTVSSLDRV